MVERNDGYIINLGSTAGTVPYPGANVYGASKLCQALLPQSSGGSSRLEDSCQLY
ncbi:MAG: SDR family NAD(P)-dependent oxidoreductase [Parasutterella sp.]